MAYAEQTKGLVVLKNAEQGLVGCLRCSHDLGSFEKRLEAYINRWSAAVENYAAVR